MFSEKPIYMASHKDYTRDGGMRDIVSRFSNKLVVIPTTYDHYQFKVLAVSIFSTSVAGAVDYADNDSSNSPVPDALKNLAVGNASVSNECALKGEKDLYIYRLTSTSFEEWKEFEGTNEMLDITKRIYSSYKPGIGFEAAKLKDSFKGDINEIDFDHDCTPIRLDRKLEHSIFTQYMSPLTHRQIYVKFFFVP